MTKVLVWFYSSFKHKSADLLILTNSFVWSGKLFLQTIKYDESITKLSCTAFHQTGILKLMCDHLFACSNILSYPILTCRDHRKTLNFINTDKKKKNWIIFSLFISILSRKWFLTQHQILRKWVLLWNLMILIMRITFYQTGAVYHCIYLQPRLTNLVRGLLGCEIILLVIYAEIQLSFINLIQTSESAIRLQWALSHNEPL